MKFRFQSFFDVSTSASSMQVIQWSVGGQEVLERCRHLFGAYKYFKLGKISVKFVPASTLPVDPQGLSYDADDPQTVDPRDQMNPGLVRITNGEDIFTNVSALGDGQQEAVYNAMMLDPRWSKFMLQSGFRRSAYPLYWQIGQLSQDYWPGATTNLPVVGSGQATATQPVYERIVNNTRNFALGISGDSSARGFFQTGHRGKLGFLPTDYYQTTVNSGGTASANYGLNAVPSVSVITCVLPKAYKTIYYYRVFVTEEVIFAGLRSSPMADSNGAQTFGLDQFLFANMINIFPGGSATRPTSIEPNKQNDGADLP